LFEQSGFRIRETRGIPAPFHLVWGNGTLARAAFALNGALVAIARGLFSYQMFFVVEPLPSLEYLLDEARSESARRVADREQPVVEAAERSESPVA
jgi:hypothetical protein